MAMMPTVIEYTRLEDPDGIFRHRRLESTIEIDNNINTDIYNKIVILSTSTSH